MDQLTPRQIQILKSLIEEYLETADAVGSDALDRKYSLGVSPATIRNEMVTLTAGGFLRQLHTSAGRVPTPRALKFYVDQLMEEKKLSVGEEVAARARLEEAKPDFDDLMQEATKVLSEMTGSLAVAMTDNGDIWHAGYARILSSPEFYDIDVTTRVLSLLEESKKVQELFTERIPWEGPVEIIFGEELHWPKFEPVGIVAAQFDNPAGRGAMGIIGPVRLNFSSIVPVVRYFGQLVSQI